MTTTYEVVGNAEDIDSIIHSVSTVDTPMHNLARKGKADGILVQWQQRELAPPGENAQKEGADAGDPHYTATEMLNNHTQILEKVFEISTSQEAVKSHGRKSEIRDQGKVKAKELKRDIEYAFTGNWDATPSGGNVGTARRMKSAGYQINAANRIDASGSALDKANMETYILDGLQLTYEAGSQVDTVYLTPTQSRIWSDIARAEGRTRDVKGSTVVNFVDTYETPFGPVAIALARNQDPETILGIDSDLWQVDTLQKTKLESLPKTGHAKKMMYSTELTLKCLNNKGSFMVSGVNYQ
ncbi:SU10 major capsid protein [Microbulbifer sp. JMSA008]|uniref:SU10 major capsid protein n=1 Tax=Microbulbifer sp. JMSA008 TaxID=3243373 RepID=UPI00403A34FF